MSKLKYTLMDIDGTDYTAIRLDEKKYGGFVFTYGKCKFIPDVDGAGCTIEYDYDVVENPKNLTVRQLKSKVLIKLMGEILVDIIQNSLEKHEAELALMTPKD